MAEEKKEPESPVPLVEVHGEGFIVKKDTGEKIPFTFEGKA